MEPTFTLNVPQWLMETINNSLVQMPWRIANPAIIEINRQINAQPASVSPPASDTGN